MSNQEAGDAYLQAEVPLHPIQKLGRFVLRASVGLAVLSLPAELLFGTGEPLIVSAGWGLGAAIGLEAAGSNLAHDSEATNSVAND